MKRFVIPVTAVALAVILWPRSRPDSTPDADNAPTPITRSIASKNTLAKTKTATATPPVTALPAGAAMDDKTLRLKKMAEMEACLESHACPFPDTDSREYEILLGKALAKEMREFRNRYKGLKEAELLARRLMGSTDGFVQREALKMLGDYPISSENLEAMTTGLQNTPDPTIVKESMDEFKRYLGSSFEPKVHGFLSTTISTGAHFSAQTVSENILPFLTPASVSTYEQAQKSMTPGSTAKHNLNWAISEYQKMQTGA